MRMAWGILTLARIFGADRWLILRERRRDCCFGSSFDRLDHVACMIDRYIEIYISSEIHHTLTLVQYREIPRLRNKETISDTHHPLFSPPNIPLHLQSSARPPPVNQRITNPRLTAHARAPQRSEQQDKRQVILAGDLQSNIRLSNIVIGRRPKL
jgi:hypothetical protein